MSKRSAAVSPKTLMEVFDDGPAPVEVVDLPATVSLDDLNHGKVIVYDQRGNKFYLDPSFELGTFILRPMVV